MNYLWWGEVPYAEAWQRQQQLFTEKIQQKIRGERPENDFILCTHPPVYTIGRNGNTDNLLVSRERLEQRGASFFKIDRGGDITFHGPGQLVGYPLIDLEQFGFGIKTYIFTIEELIIRLLATYGLQAERLAGATGVWLDPLTQQARKICAIGVRASHYVTMHGFALNVLTDLSWFSLINPCGFKDKGVTSLQKELGYAPSMDEVRERLQQIAQELFQER